MVTNLEKLKEARAILDEKQLGVYAKLKEAKKEAKRIRDEAKKNAPDKAAKKQADEICKEAIQKATEECSKVVSLALEGWAEAYEKYGFVERK